MNEIMEVYDKKQSDKVECIFCGNVCIQELWKIYREKRERKKGDRKEKRKESRKRVEINNIV